MSNEKYKPMMQISFPDHKMKAERIFCIGCNYAAHIKEIGFQKEKDGCVVFMKPNTALVASGTPLIIPTDKGEVHNEVELVLCIGKEGKNISRKTALSYIKGLSLGLDLTLRQQQQSLKEKGHPWELCKAFDNSAPIGTFTPFNTTDNWKEISFRCLVNSEVRQQGIAGKMLYPIDY